MSILYVKDDLKKLSLDDCKNLIRSQKDLLAKYFSMGYYPYKESYIDKVIMNIALLITVIDKRKE